MAPEISQNVVSTDRRLERQAESASGDLAQHRWHWTLDESNPRRVPIRTYARAVGRNRARINDYAKGYAAWGGPGARTTLSECIERARQGAESEMVTDAVATANQTTFGHARRTRREDVSRVRDVVSRHRERNPQASSAETEAVAQRHARSIVEGRRQSERGREHLRQRRSGTFTLVSGSLARVQLDLRRVLEVTPTDIAWDDEEAQLLDDGLARIEAALGMVRAAINGHSGADWDAEMAKLGGDA